MRTHVLGSLGAPGTLISGGLLAGGGHRLGSPYAPSLPRPVRVRLGEGTDPAEVDGETIEAVRESWLVEDRWWIGAVPLRRRYWELVSARGRNIVVFRDLRDGGWYTQSG